MVVKKLTLCDHMTALNLNLKLNLQMLKLNLHLDDEV